MKTFPSILASSLFAASMLLVAPAPAHAGGAYIHQYMQLPGESPSSVWFQALNLGQPAASGHAGMLALGMEPFASPGFPPAFWGGWFTWTAQGALLSYASGTIGSTVINDPSGAPILDVHGATYLASAIDEMIDPGTGNVFAATLYSGILFWTPSHVYLLLVGGVPTVYEITNAGAPISGVRGIARLAAQVIDTDISPTNTIAVLFSGALIYTNTQLFLTRTFGSIATSEVTLAGASVPLVRGVLPMGGSANAIALTAAAYLWTGSHVYQYTSIAGTTLTELSAPTGGAITGTWGMTRQTRSWSGSGSWAGAATIFTPTKQYFANTIGPIPVQEVLTPGSLASITSGVAAAGNHSMLHQAGGLMEIFAVFTPGGGGSSSRGTVIGTGQ